MAEDPRRRYAAMTDFARDLENVRSGAAIAASPDTVFERAARFVRRNRLLVTGTLTIGESEYGLNGKAAVAP